MSDMFESDDPFSGDGFGKALSFKRVREGHTYKVKVLKRPVLRQATDFTTKKPKTWPDGNPVMTVVISVENEGEKASVWAQKPSSMFRALKDAQEEAGSKIEPGDWLEITWTHSEENKKNPDMNDAKIYKAVLIKSDALSD